MPACARSWTRWCAICTPSCARWQLTEQEWEAGIGFVTGLGQATTGTHNETILASDVLGVSSLVGMLTIRPMAARRRLRCWGRSGARTCPPCRRAPASPATARRVFRSASPARDAAERHADRERAGGYLAGRPARDVRQPDRGSGGHEPPRAVPHGCRRAVSFPHGQARRATRCRCMARSGICCVPSIGPPTGRRISTSWSRRRGSRRSPPRSSPTTPSTWRAMSPSA